MIKICQHCGENIDVSINWRIFAGHVGSCIKNPNRIKGLEKLRKTRAGEKSEYKFNCKKCNEEYIISLTEYSYEKRNYRKYCSYKCSNSHTPTKEQNEKRSRTILRRLKSGEIIPHPGLKGRLNVMYKEYSSGKSDRKNKFKTFDKFKGICQDCGKCLEKEKTNTWIAHHNNKHTNKEKYQNDEDRLLFCFSCHVKYHNTNCPKKCHKHHEKYILF